MMKKGLLRALTLLFVVFLMTPIFGQKGVEDGSKFGHGEDSATCMRNLSLYKTYYDQDNYEMALNFWRHTFNECPLASKNIHIHGVQMYKTYFKDTGNRAYIDSINMVYDARIKYFGEEAYCEGRRAFDIYSAGPNDPDFLAEAYTSLNKSLSLDPRASSPQIFVVYMAVAQKLFDMGKIENGDVINIYGQLCDLLDMRASGRNAQAAVTAKENIEAIFKTGGAGTCDGLIPYFSPKVSASPDDAVLLKKVLGLLEDAKCNDSDLYYTTAENLYKIEKSALAAYHLAEMNFDKNNLDKAEVYYIEAVKLESDPLKRSNYLTKISTIELNKKEYKTARDYAKQAIENDPNNGAAYMLIGNAYASIKPFSDDFENQAVYWVAADYFIRAKQIDNSLTAMTNEFINQISGLFPTKSECFFRGILEEGASYPVGGWINENTVVRFRKE